MPGKTARLCRSENSVDKPSGVIRLRVQDDLVGQTALHDPAVMEHDDPVAKLLYQRDVVADEEIGQLPFLLQLLQKLFRRGTLTWQYLMAILDA